MTREWACYAARLLERNGRVAEAWLVFDVWLLAVVDPGGQPVPREFLGIPVKRRLA